MPGEGNVISGNTLSGVSIYGAGTNVNFVGGDKLLKMLTKLTLAKRGQFRPDVLDLESGLWWDVTTQSQWLKHVLKYSKIFGKTGIELLY